MSTFRFRLPAVPATQRILQLQEPRSVMQQQPVALTAFGISICPSCGRALAVEQSDCSRCSASMGVPTWPWNDPPLEFGRFDAIKTKPAPKFKIGDWCFSKGKYTNWYMVVQFAEVRFLLWVFMTPMPRQRALFSWRVEAHSHLPNGRVLRKQLADGWKADVEKAKRCAVMALKKRAMPYYLSLRDGDQTEPSTSPTHEAAH